MTKLESKLDSHNPNQLPMLIASEYLYFRLVVLLAYPYEVRKQIRPRIELLLHDMIHIFDELVEQNEREMSIKLGLLIAPEIINYLGIEDIEEAQRIYKYTQKSIYYHQKKNYSFYKYYDVVCKLKSTSLLNYRKSSYLLKKVIDDYKRAEDTTSLNYKHIIPTVFCNLLGLSFYLGQNEMEHILAFYSSNKQMIDSFGHAKYKIDNNLFLSDLFCQEDDSALLKTLEQKFEAIQNHHVSTINYAGILFYRNNYNESKRILKQLLQEEVNDDFYVFYCQYNLILINLCSMDVSKEKIKSSLKHLEVPSLFTDPQIVKQLERRIEILNNSFQTSKPFTPEKLDKLMNKKMKIDSPIFRKAWAFSDYQYWS